MLWTSSYLLLAIATLSSAQIRTLTGRNSYDNLNEDVLLDGTGHFSQVDLYFEKTPVFLTFLTPSCEQDAYEIDIQCHYNCYYRHETINCGKLGHVYEYRNEHISVINNQRKDFLLLFTTSRSLGILDHLIVFKYLPSLLSPLQSEVEVIKFGQNSHKVYLNSSHVLYPVSDVPSCRAGASGEECDWETREDLQEVPEEGKSFVLKNSNGEFRTKSDELQLDSVCLVIEYKTDKNTTSLIRLFLVSSQLGTPKQIYSSILEPSNSWTSMKLFFAIPDNIKGRPSALNLKIEKHLGITLLKSNIYIRGFYGCSGNVERNRFLVPQHHISANIFDKLGKNIACMNGGVHSEGTFRACVCPTGSKGLNCSQSCDDNRIGPNCETPCSLYGTKCKGMRFCNIHVGCHCASGWKGQHCDIQCPSGSYGVDCLEKCGECVEGTACDRFTGVCHKGCSKGYKPKLCRERYSHISTSVLASEVNTTAAKILMKFSSSGFRFSYYQLLYREINETKWLTTALRRRTGMEDQWEELPNLKSGVLYEAKVITMDNDANYYDGDDLPTIQFETECLENKLQIKSYNITCNSFTLRWEVERAERERCVADLYEVGMWTESGWTTQLFNSPVWNLKELLPSTEYKLRVKAVKRSNPQPYYYITVNTLPYKDESVTDLKVVRNDFKSVQLSWKSTSSSFSVLYMCEEIIPTGEDCSWDSRKFDEIKTNEVTLSSLHPFRRYKVQVCSAFDCSYIFVITSESLAQVAPELVSFTSTDSSALITWKSPSNCSLCNGIIIGYDVTLEDEHGKVEFKKRITDRTWIKAENLVPSSLYKLYIAIVTQMGSSRIPLEVDTFTKATVPFGVKDLSVYKTGRREIGLKWREPNHLFGNLSSFSVALAGDPNKTYLHSPLRCPAWPSQYYCYTITDLKPDTSYNISVSARNDIIEEDGAKTYVTATTSESAPGEPLDLWVSDESETGFTVSWSPPERFNGVLRSFLVKVEQTESYDPALCCQYYPKKEIIVQQEQPAFETQISGLSPGSTYAVSVMGETVWLGPAAKTTGNTRPPPPSPAEIDPPVTVHIQGADAIQVQWPTQPPQHSNTSFHSPVVGRVVLLLSEAENASIPQTEWKDPEVKAAVEDSIGGLDKYIVIKQFKEAGGIEVGNRGNVSTEEYNPANGYWTTSLEPVDVPAGNYSMAIVALARYCHLYSATSLTSLPFAILLN